jgi:hypothetical protein
MYVFDRNPKTQHAYDVSNRMKRMGKTTPREASIEEAVSAANAVSDDFPFEETLSQALSNMLTEALFMANDSPVDNVDVSLTPGQESAIVRCALRGALDGLADVDEDELEGILL